MPPKIKPLQSLLKSLDSKLTIGKSFLTGKLKFGIPTEYTAWHQSFKPIEKFKVPFPERWDAVKHGYDPNLIWFTKTEVPNTTGMLGERPFASKWSFTAQRPLIQTGEINNVIGKKNNTRKAIIEFGKRHGADAFEFRGISDNRVPTTNVMAISDKITPTRLSEYQRVGNDFISTLNFKKVYQTPIVKPLQIEPKLNFALDPEWEGLESPWLTVYHYGLDGQQPYPHPKFKGILYGGGPYSRPVEKPKKMHPDVARSKNLEKLLEKFNGNKEAMWNWLNKNR